MTKGRIQLTFFVDFPLDNFKESYLIDCHIWKWNIFLKWVSGWKQSNPCTYPYI